MLKLKKNVSRKKLPSVTIVGAGKVGYQLGKILNANGFQIKEVFSRSISKAAKLARISECGFTTDLSMINTTSDLYIVAVKDDAIASVIEELQKVLPAETLIVHTSGATPVEPLRKIFPRFGVFYPLQTFSTESTPDWSLAPICLDAASEADLEFLKKIAGSFSRKLYFVNDEQRAVLHIAAVFANNFSNHLFHLSKMLLEEHNLSFDLLRPLILETAKKVQNHSPAEMQTGPAARGDQHTLRAHLEFLKTSPELSEIYRVLTESISRHIKS